MLLDSQKQHLLNSEKLNYHAILRGSLFYIFIYLGLADTGHDVLTIPLLDQVW